MKRLKKLNEFYNGVMDDKKFIEIYVNPTASEITSVKNADENHSIRGVIYNDGSEFCWVGNQLHPYMGHYCSKENIQLDINTFRFAYEETWIFDAHDNFSFEELIQKIIQYKDKLSKYGDLDTMLNLFYASDNGNDYNKYNYEDIDTYSHSISFPNIASLEEFYTILQNNKSNENIS